MNKLITVNPQKSTTMGGVETLIRHIQEVSDVSQIYELFEHQPQKEHFPDSSKVVYKCFGSKKLNGIAHKFLTKNNQISVIRRLKLNQDDTVIIFHPNDLLYIPFSTLKLSKIILVQTNKFDYFFKPFSKLIMLFYAQFINHFTVYTEKDAQTLADLYPKLVQRIIVIPRGCKLPTAKEPSNHSYKLVTIARIDEDQKNFEEMISVFEELPEIYTLDIYGDGHLDEIFDLKNRVKKNPRVEYKGPTTNVAETLKHYSVFLMTSRYEGFGQTLIEARSQGLPIVAYNTFDALTWIIEDGVNGFTVSKWKRKTFAKKIEYICSEENKYKTMSENALKKAFVTEKQHIGEIWGSIL